MAYDQKVIDHFENPKNVGSFGSSQEVKNLVNIGTGIVGAPACGDVMKLQIKGGNWKFLVYFFKKYWHRTVFVLISIIATRGDDRYN